MTSRILAFPLQHISTPQLFSNIEQALGLAHDQTPGSTDDSTGPVQPEAHFRIVERVLAHLLGDDTGFSLNDPAAPEDQQAHLLALIYQSEAAYALCAEAGKLAVEEVTPWHIHQFFARLAWLNEPASTAEQAQAQLNQFLYTSTPLRSAAASLGRGDYAELGTLLDTIPEALRLWMLQFKRGARLVSMDEWIAWCAPPALYAGLAACHAESGSSASDTAAGIVWDEVSWLFASGEYDDSAVSSLINQRLAEPRCREQTQRYLQAIPKVSSPHAYLQVDVSTPVTRAARAQLLRKVVTYAVHQGSVPWLSPAMDKARTAPGRRALSLAIKLRFEQPTLTFDQVIGLAALLLLPDLASSAAPPGALPTSQAISEPVPRLDSWCTFLNPDYLFQQLGIALLCYPPPRARSLRLMPRAAWAALVQTAQFQDLFAPLLRQMQYFGAVPGEQASPRITQALAGRAIVDYFLGESGDWQSLSLMVQGSWVCDLSHVELGAKVRQLIVTRYPNASAATHDLLHYLLLREAMPELLVEGVPDHLQYGRSLQSVALIHGVALLEALMPGRSLAMPFNELINVSAKLAQSTDVRVQTLWARTLILPALRYAVAHGEVDWAGEADVAQVSPEMIAKALEFLKAQQDLHARTLHQLISLKAPDRREFAQTLLRQAGIAQGLWDQGINVHHWPVLQQAGFTIRFLYDIDRLFAFGEKPPSVLEMVMMGEAYIAGQPTADEAYTHAFETFRSALINAQADTLQRLLNEASPADKRAIMGSTCEVNRVQFGNREGVHGLLVRCQQGDHRAWFAHHAVQERFFELIPSSGVVREADLSFDFTVATPTWNQTIPITQAIEYQTERAHRQEEARLRPLEAMDSDAYLNGAASFSSARLNTPLKARLIPSSDLFYSPDASAQQPFERLAHACAEHMLAPVLEKSQVQHRHETGWESRWAKERAFADTVARWIVPFYGCVKDLATGQRSTGVVIGCALDVAFALIPMGQFVGSTARIILRASELSVVSITEQTGTAVIRLASGLAQQSGAVLIRDLGKAAPGLTRMAWAALKDLPELGQGFNPQAVAQVIFGLDQGTFRVADSLEHPWLPHSPALDRRAVLDGRANVAVRNIGTAEAPDYRLLDPEADRVFGKKLTTLSATEPVQLSRLTTAERIAPGHYPEVLPAALEDGVYRVGVDEGCQVLLLHAEEGVYTFLIDEQVYRLDAASPDAALRRLTTARLSSRSLLLEQTENLCRARRALFPVPCMTGIRLRTSEPAAVPAGSSQPTTSGQYPSEAMAAREYVLQPMSLSAAEPPVDVFVLEGKFCAWDGQAVMPLSEEQLTLLALPPGPVYKPELEGVMGPDLLLGLPANFAPADALVIHQDCPVVQLGAIAESVSDARSLRGIRMDIEGSDWIFIEPDTGVFYKAATPQDTSTALTFSRLSRTDPAQALEINEFIRLSEQYRLVRERPGVQQDRENIARLLFDLLKPEERPVWGVFWVRQVKTYDEYVQWCIDYRHENKLRRFATNILAGEDIQKNFVTLAKSSIRDFRQIAHRTLPEQQHIVEVLNQLLPVPGGSSQWETLTLEHLVKPRAAKNIMKQTKGANLAFAQVYTERGERIVYYSLSGGEKAKSLALKLDVAGRTEVRIDGVIYRDARALMAARGPDLTFTSLPVVRDVNHVSVREFSRHLDSERLIATVLKQDMQGTRISHIRVFTVLDTCRSCGGMVLPRLKADFPDAVFSVTYLKNYGASA